MADFSTPFTIVLPTISGVGPGAPVPGQPYVITLEEIQPDEPGSNPGTDIGYRLTQSTSLSAISPTYNSGRGFWLGIQSGVAKFSLGDGSSNFMTWDGSTLTIAGSFTATAGTIGGFTIGATTISATNLTLTSGAANTANITVGTGVNSAGINSANGSTDIAFWAGDTFANRATAPFRVTAGGAVVTTNIKITGVQSGSSIDGQYLLANSVGSAAANLALRDWSITCAFSSTNATKVSWGAGSLILSDGTTYSIGASDTGTMSARTYIYLDIAVSTTALQVTTTASTAVGQGKLLVATAINDTNSALFQVFSGVGGSFINGGSSIAASSITGSVIAANTITASNITTLNMTGKSCTFDTGSIGGFTMSSTQLSATNFLIVSGAANTARVEVGSGSNVGGINSPNAGSDIVFWAGDTFANRASAPFRVDAAGNVTATSATLSGYLVSTLGTFGGDGSDGALSISSGTTTISLGNAAVVVKNYTSISITGTGKLAFSNPNTNGTFIILKSQGNVTITSSATCIDASNMGAAGGAAATATGTIKAGNAGTSGPSNLFKNNNGTGAGTANGAVGTGGAVASFLYTSVSQVLNKYPTAFVGAGGGSGNANNGPDPGNTATSGAGGTGGGCLIIECGGAWNFTTSNGISVAGQNGGNGSVTGANRASGGGGGGGGYCLVLYKTLTSNSGTIVVSGGTGGNNAANNSSTNGNGGGGGGSATNAGANGLSAQASGAKDGGDGGAGISSVIQNTLFG